MEAENLRAAGIDRHDFGDIEAEVLEILKHVDGVVIALAGADNRDAIGLKKRR